MQAINQNIPLTVQTDASDFATVATLGQGGGLLLFIHGHSLMEKET